MRSPLTLRRAAAAGTALVVAAALGHSVSLGAEVNFAGSIQLDYLLVPTDDRARDFTFDGFTAELSLKAAVDVTDDISVQIKACYGCHGFEMGTAYVDFRVSDAFTVRAGRFTPTFGDFPVRHDPANHLTNDKPLPYDMGRMLRLREWNMSVLPAPYVDNGVELRVRVPVTPDVDFDAYAYAVGGLRAGVGAIDVDFIQSRSRALYYVDNNSRPAVGGRLAWSFLMGPGSTLSLGASGVYGTYDPNNALDYLVLGADLVLRIDRWALRLEYLARRTKMAVPDDPAAGLRYGAGADGTVDPYHLKEGWYAELSVPVAESVDVVARFDGMRRRGNVPLTSPLRSDSVVLRYTLGTAISLARSWRLKLTGEFYDFSDFEDEAAVHLGVAGAF